MPAIRELEVKAVDLRLKKPFQHAAAVRYESDSLFLKVTLDTGEVGWGESLPREYVSGETRDGAYELLQTKVLPKLAGRSFESMEAVVAFLHECNGRAPVEWVDSSTPQTAAWCAVDLALIDAFGKAFGKTLTNKHFPDTLRYSGALSSYKGWRLVKSVLPQRLVGIRATKLKVDATTDEATIAQLRRWAGAGMDIRCDANMGWTEDEALQKMPMMAKYGIRSFEQPLPADDLDGLATLVRETGLGVMIDESLTTPESLRAAIERKACTAANVRISKCGGLVAAMRRCREALDAGLTLQIGCQVGESSLLSAAHLALVSEVERVTYLEGCFGLHLLTEDPIEPCLQFGWGGKAPVFTPRAGLGVSMNEDRLRRYVVRSATTSTGKGGGA
jgi:muconate cycloisomerase